MCLGSDGYEAVAKSVVFLRYFEDLPDPTQRAKVMYPLPVVLLRLLAVLAGAETITDIARFGVARVREAACWAHLRRDFHDVWKATASPIARDALERIGALYDIESAISGRPRDVRHTVRQRESRPKVEAFRQWCERP